MIRVLLIFVLGISSFSFGQTKTETETWIKEKLEMYSYSNEMDVFHNYVITFHNETMTITDNSTTIFSDGDESSITLVYHVPVKDLMKIRFETKTYNVWLILKLKDGKKGIIYEGYDGDELVNSTEILLEKSILDDGLKTRLTDAFNSLVIHYGGTVTKESY